MEKQFRPTIAKINLAHFRHNVRILRQLAGEENFFCPMLKANAYGHGDLQLAKVLLDEGVDTVGVALVEEGVRLREAGLTQQKILVFEPLLDESSVKACLSAELTPVISHFESLHLIERLASHSVSVHIKFNTGMNRLGFEPTELAKVKAVFSAARRLRLEGLCSHLFRGEDLASRSSYSRAQLQVLRKIVQNFSGEPLSHHVFNSAALFAHSCEFPSRKLDFGVRPGISLYGYKPNPILKDKKSIERWANIELKPVMSVVSTLVKIHQVKKGDAVSYDARFKAKKAGRIGVVPIGYADGFTRHFSNCGVMLCDGRRVPVSGTVCMDFTMVDLSKVSPQVVREGAEVVILGNQKSSEQKIQVLTADDLAKTIKTNPYEILTNFSQRVPREYIE